MQNDPLADVPTALQHALGRQVGKVDFAQRPSYGTRGTQFQAVANCFAMQFANTEHPGTPSKLPMKPFHLYEAVTSQRNSEKPLSQRVRELVLTNMMTRRRDIFPTRGGYDGHKFLYLSQLSEQVAAQESNTFMFEGERIEDSDTNNLFNVQLRLVKVITFNGLVNLLNNEPGSRAFRLFVLKESYPALMALNAVVQTVGRLKNTVVKHTRSIVYTRAVPRALDKANCRWLELYLGYFQSVRPTVGHLMVNIDTTYGLMYKSGPLLEVIGELIGATNADKFEDKQRQNHHLIESFVKGLLITTTYGKKKARRIVRVVTQGADACWFTHANGTRETVAAFYARHHCIVIRNKKLFCVAVLVQLHGKKIEITLPLEVCKVEPGQLYRRTVPPAVVRSVVEFTATRPQQRVKDIREAYNDLAHNRSDFVRAAGIVIDNQLLAVTGRTLKAPPLLLRDRSGKETTLQLEADRNRFNFVNKTFHDAASIPSMAIFLFQPRGQQDLKDLRKGVERFTADLFKQLRGLGMNVAKPVSRELSVDGDFKAQFQTLRQVLPRPPKLLIAIMPEASEDARNSVKRAGDVYIGFATQIVVIEKIIYKSRDAERDPYFKNLALKINSKLGGVNWRISPERFPWVDVENKTERRTMIVGADVSHPGAGNFTNPSICGVVASMDSTSMRYAAQISVQTGGRRCETIVDLKSLMKPLFLQYYDKNGDWPQQLLYYRDGVGETQLVSVTDEEMQAIRDAFAEALAAPRPLGNKPRRAGPMPAITFIVVTKRHHQRFFPNDRSGQDETGNCKPGSVFDEGIAHPTLFDFYLQSQAAIKGTARPAHYIVTLNEIGYDCDTLQQLSYDLCYAYGRATLSVSIPAPVYYADLVCRREKFMFSPDFLRKLGSDSGSVIAGGESEQQLMQEYQSEFGPMHEFHADKMFFL